MQTQFSLKQYIDDGVDYIQYLKLVDEQLQEYSNSDDEQIRFLGSHIPLNVKRMERITKKFQLTDEQIAKLNSLSPMYYLLITEGWCGDASQTVPVMAAMAANSSAIDLKIVFRDKNLPLIKKYSYKNTLSIPIVVGIDKQTLEQKFVWGPRPNPGLDLLAKYKSEEAYTKDMFYNDLQKWYNTDKGVTTFNELVDLHDA